MEVYKITNFINKKIYIGYTTKSLQERWFWHKKSARNKGQGNSIIHSAIRKYKPENFQIESLEICLNFEDLLEKEKYWIKKFDSIHPIGYNMNQGGLGGKQCEETRKRKSISHKGKKLSVEHKQKISKSNLGKKKFYSESWFINNKLRAEKLKGTKRSVYDYEKWKENIRKARKHQIMKPVSDETKKKMSIARKKYWKEKRNSQ